MKKITAIAAILALTLVLGCLQEGGGTRPRSPADAEVEYGYGLKITEFSPDYEEIYSKDQFGLNIEVQNVGEEKATDIEAELSRYGDLKIDRALQTGTVELNPPDKANNIPGDSRIFTWKVTAPFKTSTTEYDVSAKARFYYASEATRDYLIMSRDRMLERKEQGTESEVITTATAGPVEVKIAPQPEEIILSFEDDEGYGTRSFPIRIDISDLGSGIVVAAPETDFAECTREIGCVDELRLYIQARPQIFRKIDCTRPFLAKALKGGEPEMTEFESATTFVNEDVEPQDGDIVVGNSYYELIFEGVQLIDKASIISCFVETSVDVRNKPYFEQTYFVRALANYRYQVEGTSKVTILGEGTTR